MWTPGPAPFISTGLPLLQRHCVLALLFFLILVPYLRLICAKAKPGWQRLSLCLPVLLVCAGAAFVYHVDEILERCSTIFVVGWLATFKVMAFCLNRGPLIGPWDHNQFALLLLLPIYPRASLAHVLKGQAAKGLRKEMTTRGRFSTTAGTPSALILRFVLKAASLGALLLLMAQPGVPRWIMCWAYSFAIYCFVGLLMDGPASAGIALFKRRSAAVLATFLVSGLVHEIILWSLQPDGKVGWKWTAFFVLQAPLLFLESWMKTNVQSFRRLPPVLAHMLTLGILYTCALYLFYPPTDIDTDTAQRVMRACEDKYAFIGTSLMGSVKAFGNSLGAGVLRSSALAVPGTWAWIYKKMPPARITIMLQHLGGRGSKLVIGFSSSGVRTPAPILSTAYHLGKGLLEGAPCPLPPVPRFKNFGLEIVLAQDPMWRSAALLLKRRPQ
eukprot:gene14095-20049_t